MSAVGFGGLRVGFDELETDDGGISDFESGLVNNKEDKILIK